MLYIFANLLALCEFQVACGKQTNQWMSKVFFAMNMKTMTLASSRAVRSNKFQYSSNSILLLCKRWHTNVEKKREREKKKMCIHIHFFWILSRGDVWTRSIPSTYVHNCTCIFMVTTHRHELVRESPFFPLYLSLSLFLQQSGFQRIASQT